MSWRNLKFIWISLLSYNFIGERVEAQSSSGGSYACSLPDEVSVEGQKTISSFELSAFYPNDFMWAEDDGTLQIWAESRRLLALRYEGNHMKIATLLGRLSETLLWIDLKENVNESRRVSTELLVDDKLLSLWSDYPNLPNVSTDDDVLGLIKCIVVCVGQQSRKAEAEQDHLSGECEFVRSFLTWPR